MRLFSNNLLSRQETTFLFKSATIYPGRWYNNYHLYHIKSRYPLVITTYSPLTFILDNIKYYCYDEYGRDKRLENINIFQNVSITNTPSDFGEEKYISIPTTLNINDYIVIKKDCL